jgi:hypothetical protein
MSKVLKFYYEDFLMFPLISLFILLAGKFNLLLNSGPDNSFPLPMGGAGDILYCPNKLDSLL